MSKKKINIIDFSKEIGVSTATVSRAFSEDGKISRKTREMVFRKADEFGYRPNIHARNLTKSKTDTLMLFYPAPADMKRDYYLSEFILGINDAVMRKEMYLQIHIIPYESTVLPPFYQNVILNSSVDGVILGSGGRYLDGLIKTLDENAFPYVVIDNKDRPQTNNIYSDLEGGAFKAGEYFRKTGRNVNAFVSGLNDASRMQGFARGLQIPEQELTVIQGGFSMDDGKNAFYKIHRDFPEINGVFCANDTLAIGFMGEALKNGVSVPADIAVIGCDNISIAANYTPSLTTINIPKHEVGQVAVNELSRLINGEITSISQKLECCLIIRDSA